MIRSSKFSLFFLWRALVQPLSSSSSHLKSIFFWLAASAGSCLLIATLFFHLDYLSLSPYRAESRKNCQKLCQKVWNLSFGLTAITCTYAELIIWNCIHTFRHLSDHRWHKYIFKKDALNNEGRFYLESGATQTSGAASAQTDATKDGFISQEKMYVDHGIIDSESVWR